MKFLHPEFCTSAAKRGTMPIIVAIEMFLGIGVALKEFADMWVMNEILFDFVYCTIYRILAFYAYKSKVP